MKHYYHNNTIDCLTEETNKIIEPVQKKKKTGVGVVVRCACVLVWTQLCLCVSVCLWCDVGVCVCPTEFALFSLGHTMCAHTLSAVASLSISLNGVRSTSSCVRNTSRQASHRHSASVWPSSRAYRRANAREAWSLIDTPLRPAEGV